MNRAWGCLIVFLLSQAQAKTIHTDMHLQQWQNLLRSSNLILIRKNACHQLAKMEDLRALADLHLAARSDASPEVRGACVLALARLAEPSSIQSLKVILSSDQDAKVRRSAQYALDQIQRRLDYVEKLDLE